MFGFIYTAAMNTEKKLFLSSLDKLQNYIGDILQKEKKL